MTQSLAQLQADWRAIATKDKEPDSVTYMLKQCADELKPHVEREAAAQAKSLADERRIAAAERITDLLIEICDHSPPLLLMHRISALASEAKAYRTQYPRVEEEK